MHVINLQESPTGRYHVWTRADRLRVARESLGPEATQAVFAARLGVGRNTVGRYESFTDDVPVKESTIKLWALATGFDYQWLMTGAIPDLDGDWATVTEQ